MQNYADATDKPVPAVDISGRTRRQKLVNMKKNTPNPAWDTDREATECISDYDSGAIGLNIPAFRVRMPVYS